MSVRFKSILFNSVLFLSALYLNLRFVSFTSVLCICQGMLMFVDDRSVFKGTILGANGANLGSFALDGVTSAVLECPH